MNIALDGLCKQRSAYSRSLIDALSKEALKDKTARYYMAPAGTHSGEAETYIRLCGHLCSRAILRLEFSGKSELCCLCEEARGNSIPGWVSCTLCQRRSEVAISVGLQSREVNK